MHMHIVQVMLCCLVLILAQHVVEARSWPKWQQRRVALDRCLVKDEFRVYYTLTGDDGLAEKDRRDADDDGVPDKIQNIALQLAVARSVYADVMGLRHPFESPRYKDRVRYFDVHVWATQNAGSAGDAIVNYHRPTDPDEGVEVLTIDISEALPTRNLTPAHKLFHEFQNGYTLFKNRWYTEGTARWSEFAFQEGIGRAGPLPTNTRDLEELFKLDYGASLFWNALAQAADCRGKIDVPATLRRLPYVGGQVPIIEDDTLYGSAFIKALLEELDRMDNVASRENSLDPLNWQEARQKSPENNKYIWSAVMNVCRRCQGRSPALRNMVAAFSGSD